VLKLKMKKMKKIALLFTLAVSLSTFAQEELPTVDLTTLDGNKTTIQDAVDKEGVTIVSLWATWCVPCIKELDAISDIYDDWKDETGVSLIAVSVDDSRTVKRVKPLINGKGWEYEILLDTNNDLKRALGAASVPLTIVIKDNKIVYRHSGYNPGAENELYEKVKEYTSK
jgi:thiol-disulfide isomerase/thioredoxin